MYILHIFALMNGYYIFCDESLKRGQYYSNFYGGLLINKKNFERINNLLLSKKMDLEMEDSELKWSQVNTFKLDAYKEMMDIVFELVKQDILKIRIMFTDNRFLPQNISAEKRDKEYHLLYYQFIKHAFGFKYLCSGSPIDLEIFFDKIPDNKEKNKEFKKFIYGIQFLPDFSSSKIRIKEDSIYEVDSKKHILLQCLDVILGSMAFRLNNLHLEKPIGSKRRGKRTIAKEKLYKYINAKIREIRPNFNIGVSTSIDGNHLNHFEHPYRHWIFISKQ